MDADLPYTRTALADDLASLGLRRGSVLLVHSSLTALGWVCGGPVAVVQALLDALGPDGTLVVPTHTPDNTDPAGWQHPPVPESWWPVIRAHTPGFDPAVTPSRWMGVIAETVRTWPGARRSDHPQVSFAAVGPAAEAVVGGHQLDEMLGTNSPVGAVYRLDGDVLLLGVGHRSNTSLHLAEYGLPDPPRRQEGSAVRTATGRAWMRWQDVDTDESDFDRLGDAFESTGSARIGQVGGAECRLMRQRLLVDFAVDWFATSRAPRKP
ncbi:aminoglycoside N(3)-acetyltransferase [Micromonospora endophytica]|uniref:Aminoglycoside N(3)-acetyltransferase n=1 Tax=Micromonospora endophytica TaxID=515350 RepID=A0A2W2BNR1_9ACTN|nr:AAC(3) family N-acetyltransferase [Micromonospora endophytica]PZF86990.1 AAC(3) family N-acetyltransferase [Micromonospora endophytica]RIW48580.1 aminoglycoside N(3)-acetyltransferase [Micromonospora endophytica]BCJ61071.1 AAC(3) family N-acetyltransferase [Micromonospora endophytica]